MKIYDVIFSTSDLWLFGACGALFLVLIRLRFTTEIRDRDIFNSAAKEFIAAFQNELTRLRLEATCTYDIIKPALIKHGEAYSIFRRYLRGRDLEKFNSAWRIYYVSTPPCQDDKKTKQENGLFSQEYEDERTAIIERIEVLLDFAKFK